MFEPLVSIIIPSFNRTNLIGETLDSVLAQSYENWECIVVDDGSTDYSIEVLNKYCKIDNRIRYYQRPTNLQKGANPCRNFGFKKSKGKFIQWFDSDDLMHVDLLKFQIENIQRNNVPYSICNFSFFRIEINKKEIKPFNDYCKLKFSKEVFIDFVSGKILLNTPTILWRRESIEEYRYDESLYRAQDLDYIFSALVDNIQQVDIINVVLVHVRRHKQSITDAFKNRNKKSIYSEINVRNHIWNELVQREISDVGIQGAIKMYLQSIKYLLYIKNYRIFFRKLFYVLKTVKFKLKLIVIKLFVLALFYIFTKRGITKYQKIINNL
jgi:glycosyltransferase involved in cell wall biosynthesis